MKYFSSLVVAALVACVGWSLLYSGAFVLGVAVLGLCFVFAYLMSIHLAFGSMKNYVNYLEEIQLWASTMIR